MGFQEVEHIPYSLNHTDIFVNNINSLHLTSPIQKVYKVFIYKIMYLPLKKLYFCFIILILLVASLSAQENTILKTRKILLLPTQDATNNEAYKHLRMYIFNVLKSNLLKYENLEVIFLNDNFSVSLYDKDFESIVKGLSEQYTVESFIFGEYFVDNRGLHVFVNVWDAASLRVKNLFMKSMPADLDMLENIEGITLMRIIVLVLNGMTLKAVSIL